MINGCVLKVVIILMITFSGIIVKVGLTLFIGLVERWVGFGLLRCKADPCWHLGHRRNIWRGKSLGVRLVPEIVVHIAVLSKIRVHPLPKL